MLQLDALSKSFGPTLLFRDLKLSLSPGDYVAVMGESGSGKSTFLNIVAGLESPDAGQVRLDDVTIDATNDDAATLWRRRHLGFVFQSFHVLPQLTIAQNVSLPLKLNGWSPANIRERTDEMLKAVGLADRHASYPRELSGGETQRVAIARALVHRPRLLLADEPTGNLDPATADTILALLAGEIRRNGAMGILVTHSASAAATTDRALRLTRDGLVNASAPDHVG
jgi:putative ABC transport system ATP-binding protein